MTQATNNAMQERAKQEGKTRDQVHNLKYLIFSDHSLDDLGFLRPQYAFAYYNLPCSRVINMRLEIKKRGGLRFKKDFGVFGPVPRTRAPLSVGALPGMPQVSPSALKDMMKKMGGKAGVPAA